jgi:hypothetical protein
MNQRITYDAIVKMGISNGIVAMGGGASKVSRGL